jgi:hypothetical protein
MSNHDFALIAVAADDGSVTLAENRSAREQNWHIAGGVEVTEEQALERATAVLWLMGARPDEVHLDRVKLHQSEGAGRGTWLVYWNRATGGVPYSDDEAHVVLDANSGTVLYATKRWFSAPPAATETKIGKERARETALGLADAIGAREITGIRDEPALRIVQPNYHHSAARETRRPEYQGPTRVAWEVTALLPSPMPGAREREAIFWIDAVTGELLGGYGFRGG